MRKLLLTILLCSAPGAWAAAGKDSALYQEIAAMDTALFDAFNRRDQERIQAIFSKDLEFYHDKGGLSTYEQSVQNTRRLFERNKTLKRQLVPGTMQVYPVKDYGAIQTAEHRFCHAESGKEECGVYKLLHIWKRSDGAWKLTRVVSYDH
jgi:hypothetical protein